MQRILFRLLLLLCLVGYAGSDALALTVTPRKGVVRVKLQAEMASQVGTAARKAAVAGELQSGALVLDASLKQLKGVSIRRVLPYNARFEAQRARFGLDRWYEITFDESVSPVEARRILAETPGVQYATTVAPMVLKDGGDRSRAVIATAIPAATGEALPFNDPRLPSQWHYRNTGKMEGAVKGADINVFEAWQSATGSSNVLVAVIDGGIDVDHEDLAANMYVNTAELNGTPGVDDDGNGYVDDIYGYNFCTNEGEIYPHNHGTHVAGTVAAVNNNGIGVAGVAGGDGTAGSGVRLLSCQVFDSRSGAGDGDFAAALVYAAEMGAHIAQCSWGWATPGYYEQDVLDAIEYFQSLPRANGVAGGLCIFAAGNDGVTGDCYPACLDNVLAVASMTYDLHPASYSNYGAWVDVTAPGGLMDFNEAQGVLSTLPNDKYGYMEGTSMACPHVSGIAALILSKYSDRNLSPALLKTQLETSVNDFYTANPAAVGLYGSGYVDAAKALMMSSGEAPAVVSDLSADAAQDVITLHWTIPTSSDNNVNHHVLYYSTTSFDDSTDPATLKAVTIDTKFMASGDLMTYELGGLLPMTTYYLAIKAIDRWGNASELSDVITATTNSGPKMTINKTSLSMVLSSAPRQGKGSFVIGNDDEGLLKWAYNANTISASIKSYAASMPPTVANTVAYNGTLGVQPYAASTAASVEAVTELNRDDYPLSLQSWSTLYAYVGDSDPSLPNSMAQYFVVDPQKFPDGFNLTAVNAQGAYGTNPTIEVYKGANLTTASKVVEFSPSSFYYGYNMALPEQFYFAAGESFWVVFHFAAQSELYPLGMGVADDTTVASQAYMSNDMGATWMRLSDALAGSKYAEMASSATWCITAVSLNPDFSQLVTLTPASGTVKSGETQTVEVLTDGSKLCNGSYKFNLRFTTNESQANTLLLPINVTVTNQQPQININKIINFGDLLVGESRTITVEVFNEGYGAFSGSSYGAALYGDKIKSTSEHFSGPSYMQSGFQPRATTNVDLTFAPKAAGSHTGQIIFTDKSGNQVAITVQGVATDPAEISITPQTVEVGTLTVGDEARDVQFEIANTGNYPLQFVFPKFSDESVPGASDSKVHKFGYSYTSNLGGSTAFAYDGNPELIDAVDITSQFNDNNPWSSEIALGFDFPYYGTTYDHVYVTDFGGVAFSTGSDLILRSPLSAEQYRIGDTGMISAYGTKLQMGPQSRIAYAKQDGKFIVTFSNVLAVVYDTDYTPISFHMSLAPNGNIEVFYDSYDPAAVFEEGTHLFLGINDTAVADPLTVTDSDIANSIFATDEERTEQGEIYAQIGTGSAFHFEAPRPSMIAALSPTYGIVPPGNKTTITATVQATDEMYAGDTFNNLVVMSNDPINATSLVRFNATIAGDDLKPQIALAQSTVDFGDVFRTSVAKKPVTVRNTGKADLTVSAVTVDNGIVSTDITLPLTIPAGQSKDIIVTVPTDTERAIADAVTVTSDAGTVTAQITANVIGCPTADLSYTELTLTLPYGADADKPLTITNNGNEALSYALLPGAHVTYTPQYDGAGEVQYSYASSADDPSVKMQWVDIETTGLGTQNNFTYYLSHDYVAVELPFEFPFYGEKYTTMYIYNTGFVSFTQRKDEQIWPEPPADFPGGTIYTNLIAPYWGLHSMDQSKGAGTYYYVTDDRAVISWMEYGNTMNLGVCYQLILNADGSFKYQYKPYGEYAVIFGIFGLAGISNADGSQGFKIPDRYVAFNQAVEFTPIVTTSLAPGQSRTESVVVHADEYAGTYTGDIKLTTNVPGKESVTIPVNMTITGTPEVTISDDITIEHPVGYQDTDYDNFFIASGALYVAEFEVANTGSAPFTVTDIAFDAPKVYDEYFGDWFDVLHLYYYVPEYDWFGDPTGNYTWMQYNDYNKPQFTVTDTPLRLAIPMMPSELSGVVGTYTITTTLTFDDGTTKTHTTTFIITPAPKLTIDKKEVRVTNAASDLTTTESVTISNTGAYKLNYELTLAPTGVGYVATEGGSGGGGGVMPTSLADTGNAQTLSALSSTIVPYEYGKSDNFLDLPQDFEYRNGLYYPVLPGDILTYTYGSGSKFAQFKSATYFEAPEQGFNISHIYTVAGFEGLSDVDLTVEIFKGDDIAGNGTIVGRGTASFETTTTQGRAMVVALDRPVYMNPGEKFYVVITYPLGVLYPAYVASKEEAVVPNRYMGYVPDYGWFDVATMFKDQYGSLGYLTACLETVEGDAWCKLSPATPTTGTINVGESATIDININAASAPLDYGNKAVLVISSTDPSKAHVNFPIYLDRNGAPIITLPAGTIYAKEGIASTVAVDVVDADGDDFTVTLADNGGITTITDCVGLGSATPAITIGEGGTDVTVSGAGTAGVRLTLTMAPDYGDAGNYSILLNAADTQGHESQVNARYTVEHVNRAPVPVEGRIVEVAKGQASEIIDFASLFTDPDGDDIICSYTIDNAALVTTYESAGGLILVGAKIGTTTLRVTATDALGATAVAEVTIEVKDHVGITDADITAGISIYPNPVVETLRVTLGRDMSDVTFAIYATNGSLLRRFTSDVAAGVATAIDVADLPAATYLLRIEAEGTSAAYVIIKE